MMGKWLAGLVARVSEGAITPREAMVFLMWRIRRSPRPISMGGVRFHEIDRMTWGIIAGIILEREYNPPGFEIGPEDIVIDIGAHRGVFLAFAAAQTGATITGVEPDPENFRVLGLLVRSNKMENVRLVNAAVAAATGEARLYQGTASSRHTLTGIDVLNGAPLARSESVRTISLDELCRPHPAIHFMKMDCEGAEHEIIQSAREDTLGKIKRLVMEVHHLGQPQTSELLLRKLARSFSTVAFRKTSNHTGMVYARRK